MNDIPKVKIALLSSAKLNDKAVFETCRDQIANAVKGFDADSYQFIIGNIKNRVMIEYVKSLGYEVTVVTQHIKSLANSNKKIIRESHGVIFFIYDKSSVMMDLLEYAHACHLDTIVPVYFHSNKKNSTYLFAHKNGFSHSESRWNAIAQLAMVWMGRHGKQLGVYRSKYESKYTSEWLRSDKKLSFSGWNSKNTIVEGRLNNKLFEIESWSEDYDNISPDIVHIDQTSKKVVMIEVKTIRSSIKSNLNLYRRLADAINSSKVWSCEMYYLLSYGHETLTDWKLLNEKGEKILLWEELFFTIAESDLAPYIDSDLSQYTLMPPWLPETA